jgi:hypothetical protein
MATLLSPELIGVPPPLQPFSLKPSGVAGAPPASHRLGGPMLVISVDPTAIDGALRIAQLLARRDRVNAHILGVVPPFPSHSPLLTSVDYDALDEGRRHVFLSALRRHVHRTVGRPAHFSTGAEVGRTPDAIDRVARARRSALILTGLEPKGTPRRIASEQLTLRAVSAADAPVLAVPVQASILPRRTLVAMDFGSASIRAARAAFMTTGRGGTVTLAHVAAPTGIRSESASETFGRVLPALGAPDGIDVETVILEGDPTAALLRLALAERHDLIAVGSRASIHSEFRLAGSVCLDLLRGAMGAILIAPPTR